MAKQSKRRNLSAPVSEEKTLDVVEQIEANNTQPELHDAETIAEATDVSASGEIKGRAYRLVLKLQGDEDKVDDDGNVEPSLLHLIDKLATDGENVKRGPLTAYWKLKDLYGDDGLMEFPEPDSEQGKTGNRPYDKGDIPMTVDGVQKTRKGNFYTEWFAMTALGRALDAKLAALDAALNPKASQEPLTQFEATTLADHEWIRIVRDCVDRSDVAYLNAEKDRISGRKTDGRNVVKKALRLHFGLMRLADQLGDNIGVEYVTYFDGDGNEHNARTVKPFYLYDKHKPAGSANAVTIPQMLSLTDEESIATAKQAGGKLSNLLALLRRETGKDKAKNKDIKSIASSMQFMESIKAQGSYLDMAAEDGSGKAHYHSVLTNLFKGKSADQNIMTFGDLYAVLTDLFNEPQVIARYERLSEERAAQERKETAELRKRNAA